MSDFDHAPDRRGSGSIKWDHLPAGPSHPDPIPLWVADMDWQPPAAVREALTERAQQGVLGYTAATEADTQAVVAWLARRFDWRVEPDWIVWTPGVMPGMRVAASLGEGDGVLTTTPIYPVFLNVPKTAGKRLIESPIVRDADGRWRMDYAGIAASGAKTLLHCAPHNPVGRVWERDELLKLAEVACANDILVCADEIWADLVLDEQARHLPIASLHEEIAARTITFLAASKTFSITGLYAAYAVVPDERLRRRFRHALQDTMTFPNLLGVCATRAAYEHGEAWLDDLLIYLRANRDLAVQEVNAILGLQTQAPEATFLVWIDATRLQHPEPWTLFAQAGAVLHDGRHFGAPGWLRLNIGCPRPLLEEALRRMREAVAGL